MRKNFPKFGDLKKVASIRSKSEMYLLGKYMADNHVLVESLQLISIASAAFCLEDFERFKLLKPSPPLNSVHAFVFLSSNISSILKKRIHNLVSNMLSGSSVGSFKDKLAQETSVAMSGSLNLLDFFSFLPYESMH